MKPAAQDICNGNPLVYGKSSIDDAWDDLTMQQKMRLLKSHTKDFGMTRDELKILLFTLPLTEQEINTAFAVNSGGAVFYWGTSDVARISKFNKDNSADITTLTLKSKETGRDTVQQLIYADTCLLYTSPSPRD